MEPMPTRQGPLTAEEAEKLRVAAEHGDVVTILAD
jgi:hypothetical protein